MNNQSEGSNSFLSNPIEEKDDDNNLTLEINQGQLFEALDESIIRSGNPHQQFEPEEEEEEENYSEFLGQTTTLLNNNELPQLARETILQINTVFNQKLNGFVPLLISNTKGKSKELSIVKELISQMNISYLMIQEELEFQDNLQFQLQQKFYSSRKDILKHQKRNTVFQSLDRLLQHQNEGQQLQFVIHDARFTPLYLSHNPVLIYIQVKDFRHASPVLDLVEQYFRNPKILQHHQQPNNHYVQKNQEFHIFARKENENIDSINVSLKSGNIDFIIKAGVASRDYDKYKAEIMQVYCDLSTDLKKMCSFLSYWGHMRGILTENALPEFALFCMVIDFFKTNSLVPNIFQDYYNTWSEEKRKLAKSITNPNDERLKTEFSMDDYIIYTTKQGNKKVKAIHWLSFPRFKDVEVVQARWKEKCKKVNNGMPTSQLNLGQLISQFFHVWSQSWKYTRPLTITEFNPIVTQEEIGLVIKNPLLPQQVLTPLLVKRARNSQYISSNLYYQVRGEFERAYQLILDCKFDKLCDKQDKFL